MSKPCELNYKYHAEGTDRPEGILVELCEVKGWPYVLHVCNPCISKLIAKGYKVVRVEPLEECDISIT